jgi:subtilisin family serine protease
MSLGRGQHTSTCDSDIRKPIIDNLRAAGIATVISSGNDGWSGSTGAPGCISTAITVGSSTKTDQEASYSNMAPWVDLFGPGSAICSSIVGVTANCGSGYAAWNGTSMAAPQVTGAWAVMKSKKPTATVSEIEQALESTGVPINTYLGNWPRIALVPALAQLSTGGGIGLVTGLSAQGKVGINNEQLFGTFTISGDSRRVLIRGLGPTLTNYGTAGAIQNPQIRLTPNGSNTTLYSNDNWQQAWNAAEIQRLGWQPAYATESVILETLSPGIYNIYMSPSTGATSGVGMLEVFPK